MCGVSAGLKWEAGSQAVDPTINVVGQRGGSATIENFARKVSAGLEIADQDFEARRQIIGLLDVRVTLAIEDGEKIAYLRCLLDEASLPIESTSPRCCRGYPRAQR